MKKKIFSIWSVLIFCLILTASIFAQNRFKGPVIPGVFSTEDKGYFTFIPRNHDKNDSSSPIHFWGSFGLRTSLYYFFKTRNNSLLSDNAGFWSTSLTLFFGTLKEIEDGRREGFSFNDLQNNIKGTTLSCLTTFSVNLAFSKYSYSPPPPTMASELEKHLSDLSQRVKDVFQEALTETNYSGQKNNLNCQTITFPDSLNNIVFIYQTEPKPRYIISRHQIKYFIDLQPPQLTFCTPADILTFTSKNFIVNSAVTANKKLILKTDSQQNFKECLGLISSCRSLINDFQIEILSLKEKRELQFVKNAF